MNPVVHFEMPVEDRERVAAFYTEAFGWRLQWLGPEMGDYVLATTTESGPDGRPKKPGAINGGFFPKSDEKPGQYPSVVIAVPDIQEHMKKVNRAGGKVLGDPMEIPGIGWYVAFLDTEGNRVSMLQPSRSSGTPDREDGQPVAHANIGASDGSGDEARIPSADHRQDSGATAAPRSDGRAA